MWFSWIYSFTKGTKVSQLHVTTYTNIRPKNLTSIEAFGKKKKKMCDTALMQTRYIFLHHFFWQEMVHLHATEL